MEIEGRKYTVYKYSFPDGKVYIGVTSLTLEQRRDNGYNHNARLKQALRKHGWKSVGKEVLASGVNQDEAFSLEKEYIAKYDSTNEDLGYNISKGGRNTYEGLRHTEEYKARMSEMNKGKVFSEEAIANMRNGHRKERKPVLMKGESGAVTEFESLGSAANAVSGHKSNISRVCGSGKSYKGFIWEFKKDEGVVLG